MDNNRRQWLKGSVAASVLVGSHAVSALAATSQPFEGQTPFLVPPALNHQQGYRLATFIPSSGEKARVGVVLDDGQILDVAHAASVQKIKLGFDPFSMLSLIATGNHGIAELQKLLAHAGMTHGTRKYRVDHVKLLSPIPKPQSNIYAVGWNYLDHFEEGLKNRADKTATKIPDHPVFFSKGVFTMNGPFDPIPYDPSNSPTADWEVELAIIIGQRGRDISEADAMNYVYGYSVYNDTTVREVQQKRHGGQWFKGKSLDGYGPMGPWIVTANGFDLNQARMICRVNGVEKQNGSYEQMYFKIPRIIAELSRGTTLDAGDIIATGTPPGVGFARTPPEFLKAGDVMESEITGIGIIRNTIKTES